MRFQDLSIKHSYDSVRDDLYADFFSPVLAISCECKRLGGNFTSKYFLKIAEGMRTFIENDGIMKLVVLPNFSQEDVNAINSGLKNEDDVLLENWINDYDDIEEEFIRDHTKALAWMIKKGFLDIKHAGGGLMKDTSKYSISERWQDYGTDSFIQRNRKKDVRGLGFKKKELKTKTMYALTIQIYLQKHDLQ